MSRNKILRGSISNLLGKREGAWPGDSPGEGLRLQVYLSRAGLGSRRACERLIEQGRVAVNGKGVVRMGEKVFPGDKICLDGRSITSSKASIYLALNKPRGYICANSDPERRPLAGDLFRPAIKERLFHVGRLDFLSTGLIFYTNDGEFARIVSHPGSRIEKEYLVQAVRPVGDVLMRYVKGIRVGGVIYRCSKYSLHSENSALVTLREGKNREIRNVFASRNIRLKKVHRIRIGAVSLKGIAPGRFRKLTQREVRWFFDHGSRD